MSYMSWWSRWSRFLLSWNTAPSFQSNLSLSLSHEDSIKAGSNYCIQGGKGQLHFICVLIHLPHCLQLSSATESIFRGEMLWGQGQYRIQSQFYGLTVRWIDRATGEPCFPFFLLMDKLSLLAKTSKPICFSQNKLTNLSFLHAGREINVIFWNIAEGKLRILYMASSVFMFLSSQMETIRLPLLHWMVRGNLLVQFQLHKAQKTKKKRFNKPLLFETQAFRCRSTDF